MVLPAADQESEESKPLGIGYYLQDKYIIIRRGTAMYISTAHFDDLLQRLDPDEDREMYGLTQGLLTAISEMSYALLGIDSRLDEIEQRLTDLEKQQKS